MIEITGIEEEFDPIEFDQDLPVDVAQITDSGVFRAKGQLNEISNLHPDYRIISRPITPVLGNYLTIEPKYNAGNKSSLADDFRDFSFYQHEQGKLADVTAAKKGDKRLKYGVLTLKPYNKHAEHSLPTMIEKVKRFDQEFFIDVHNNETSINVPTEVKKAHLPSNQEISKVVEVILGVKGNDDQFTKVQVTKALRNTSMRAKDIDRVLNYLSAVLGSLMQLEVIKSVTGRPPSPKYQIIWGKSEYFPERNKDWKKTDTNQNKVE
jgi:hypothetical protein